MWEKDNGAAFRSLLMDVFREAVVEGILERNPAEPTRTPAPEVKRERMTLDNYLAIRQAAISTGAGWLTRWILRY